MQVCIASGRSGGHVRRGRREERRAADAVEQVRREPALEEVLVGEQRPVDRHVRDEAVDDELVEGDPARAMAVARSGPQTTSLPSSES